METTIMLALLITVIILASKLSSKGLKIKRLASEVDEKDGYISFLFQLTERQLPSFNELNQRSIDELSQSQESLIELYAEKFFKQMSQHELGFYFSHLEKEILEREKIEFLKDLIAQSLIKKGDPEKIASIIVYTLWREEVLHLNHTETSIRTMSFILDNIPSEMAGKFLHTLENEIKYSTEQENIAPEDSEALKARSILIKRRIGQ
ncbi:MAG: hypothetical protein WCK59_00640 [Candidatus Falkowbacteria bacterium]